MRSASPPPRPPIRWGLVFVMVLVGTVGLGRAIAWYFDPLRELDRNAAVVADTRTPAAGTPARRPTPTPEEIALITAADPGVQAQGAAALLGRAITADVITAVNATLPRTTDARVTTLLVCLKARFEDAETLDYLIGRLPALINTGRRMQSQEFRCVLDALAARISESPERVTTALLPAVFVQDVRTRQTVIEAFRRVDLAAIPPDLLADAAAGPRRPEAIAAAIALGALQRHPALVEAALRDEETLAFAAEELRVNPEPRGARMVASAWVENFADSRYASLATARERALHDVSAALLEIAEDQSAAAPRRLAAVRHLASLGEVGALAGLRSLDASLPAGELKAALAGTVDALQAQRAAGVRDQMRTLTR